MSPPQHQIWNTSRHDIAWDIYHLALEPALQSWRNKWESFIQHNMMITQHDINTCWGELKDIILHSANKVVEKNVYVYITNISSPLTPTYQHYIEHSFACIGSSFDSNTNNSPFLLPFKKNMYEHDTTSKKL